MAAPVPYETLPGQSPSVADPADAPDDFQHGYDGTPGSGDKIYDYDPVTMLGNPSTPIDAARLSDILGRLASYAEAKAASAQSTAQTFLLGGAGQATVTAGQTSVVVNHGISTVPTVIFLNPVTDTLGARWRVSARTASTFTITLNAAQASDITFDWTARLASAATYAVPPTDPVAATPGLRSLGAGAQQAAAGDGSSWPAKAPGSMPVVQTDGTIRWVAVPYDVLVQPSGDTTGASDQSKLLAAITTGGTIALAPGVYYISNILWSPTRPVTIIGYGATIKSTLNKTDNTIVLQLIGNGINILGVTFDYVTPLTVDGDAAARAAAAMTIRLGPAHPSTGGFYTDCMVRDCTIKNSRNTPISITGYSRARVINNTLRTALGNGVIFSDCPEDVLCEGNFIDDTGDDSIAVVADADYAAGSTRVTIAHNTCKRTYAQGIDITGADGVHIHHNHIDRTWAPGIIAYHLAGLEPSPNVIIDHNEIRNAGTYFGTGQYKTADSANGMGIKVTGSDQVRVMVRNNLIIGSTNRGINVANSAEADVIGNRVYGGSGVGFDIGPLAGGIVANNRAANNAGHGMFLNQLVGCSVTGNVAYNNNTAGDGSSDNFAAASCSGCVFVGNSSVDDRGTALIDAHFDFSGTGSGNTWGPNSSYAPNAPTKGNRWASGVTAWRWAMGGKTYAPTYGTTVTADPFQGDHQRIVATNGTGFTITSTITSGAQYTGLEMLVDIVNSSGGALGTISWNAAFSLTGGTLTAPANGSRASLRFRFDGTNWVEVSRVVAPTTPTQSKSRDQLLREGLGIISEAFSPTGIGATAAPTSQSVYALAVGYKAGDIVTGSVLRLQTAAAGTAPTLARFGLLSSARTVLVLSADKGAAANWAAGAPEFDFTAPYTIPADGVYYHAFVVNGTWGTTQPALGRAGNAFASGLGAAAGGVQPALLVTAQTDLPAVGSTLGAGAGSSPVFYQAGYGTPAAA